MSGVSYESSGVSLARGDAASSSAILQAQETYDESVVIEHGQRGRRLKFLIPGIPGDPVFSEAVDGVGTKLIYAALAERYDTVGEDLVAMVIDDHSRYNRKPISFAWYRGSNRISLEQASLIMNGVVEGCKKAQVPLLGGETAEMPNFYVDPHFEIVGFSTALHEYGSLRVGQETVAGDILIAVPSNGGGSNGFTLLRRVFTPRSVVAGLCAVTIEEILAPTPIYTPFIMKAMEECKTIRGWAHITGGGLGESGKLAHLLPEGLAAKLDPSSWEVPHLFKTVQEVADISDENMRDAFNLGLMMVAPVAKEEAEQLIRFLESLFCRPMVVGKVIEQAGERKVVWD